LGGSVAVAGAAGVVGEVFTISGFRQMMPVVDTVEDAVAAV
jgi:hypothetical protein